MSKALSFVADEGVRKRVGINPKNPYLFAKLGEGNYDIWDQMHSLKSLVFALIPCEDYAVPSHSL